MVAKALPEQGALEAVVLSTCNRNELYIASPTLEAVNSWMERFRALRPEAPLLRNASHTYRKRGSDAAWHLFRVACGLESSILGDSQILGQVRRAMTESAKRGLLGALLQKTFALAVGAGSRARRHSEIGRGAAGIGSAVAEMIARRASEGVDASWEILIVGAGEIARDAGRQLARRGLGRLTFVNRSQPRAEALARELQARSLPWTSLDEALTRADVVVTAASSSTPILSRHRLDAALGDRSVPLLVFDLGMPRNVEPGSGCDIVDIDHIQERRETTFLQRRSAIPRVERIVDEALVAWRRITARQSAEVQIKNLYRAATEVSRLAGAELAGLGHVDPRVAERVVLRSIKRLLHTHVRDLREAGASRRGNDHDGKT
jgi:glutamyl-tRNA reductase